MDAPMKNTYHELVRDLFIFSVFTGLGYSDMKNLTTDNLQTFFDGNLWIIAGELYSEEHKRKFTVENVTARIAANDTDRRKLTLKIDGQPIGE